METICLRKCTFVVNTNQLDALHYSPALASSFRTWEFLDKFFRSFHIDENIVEEHKYAAFN